MGETFTAGEHDAVPDHIPAQLVKDFDFRYSPQVARDPWHYFAEAKQGEPIFWTPCNGGHWVVSGTEVVDEVFRRHELFSNGVVTIPAPPRPQSIPSGLDPPEHGKYRKILSQRLFSPKALAPIEQFMDEVFERLGREVLPRGRCDFIAAYARPLPVAIVLKIMGLSTDMQDSFCEWSRMMFHGQSIEEHLTGYKQAFGYLGDWLEEQQRNYCEENAQDFSLFIRELAEGRVDGRSLTHEEMRSMAMLLVGAGVDTMTAQMGHAMLHFATHPADRERLVDEPALIPRAIEELLRRYGIANITRVVAKDQEYRGVTMKKGELVLCASAMGAFDESVYEQPMDVDFDRPTAPKRHTPFGAGPHVCPGAYLARTMLRGMLERLLPAMPGLRLAEDADLTYVSGVTIGLTALPLEWDSVPGSRS